METVRDIAIIILALLQIIAVVLVIVIAYFVLRLVKLLIAKVHELSVTTRTIIDQAQDVAANAADSARTVKGSVSFVSDTVVTPVIGVAAAAAGAKSFVDALFRGTRHRDREETDG